MKKVKHTDITNTSAMPFKSGTLEHLQSAHIQTTQVTITTMQATTPLVGIFGGILYGCNVSYTGLNWIVTAGAVFLNGEVFECDSAAGTLVGTDIIVGTITTTNITAANYDPSEFSDSALYNVHEVRKIVWTTGASGSADVNYNNVEGTRMGRSVPFTYNSAYLTASTGAWTIASSAFWNVKYIVLSGAAVMVDFEIIDSTTSLATSSLRLELPFKTYESFNSVGWYTDGANEGYVRMTTAANDNRLFLSTGDGANWPISPGLLIIKGQIIVSLIAII